MMPEIFEPAWYAGGKRKGDSTRRDTGTCYRKNRKCIGKRLLFVVTEQ